MTNSYTDQFLLGLVDFLEWARWLILAYSLGKCLGPSWFFFIE